MIKATVSVIKFAATAVIRNLPKLVLNPHSVDHVMKSFVAAQEDLSSVVEHHKAKQAKHGAAMDKAAALAWTSRIEAANALRVKDKLEALLS